MSLWLSILRKLSASCGLSLHCNYNYRITVTKTLLYRGWGGVCLCPFSYNPSVDLRKTWQTSFVFFSCWEMNDNPVPNRLLNWPIMASVIVSSSLWSFKMHQLHVSYPYMDVAALCETREPLNYIFYQSSSSYRLNLSAAYFKAVKYSF